MARFSERIGVSASKTVLQLDSMDDDLRIGLWNVCFDDLFKYFLQKYFRPYTDTLVGDLWRHFFKMRVDEIPNTGSKAVGFLKEFFFVASWNAVYDFIEFLANTGAHQFPDRCNYILQREMSGYRFSGTTLVPITDAEELEAIHKAMGLPSPLQPVRVHLSSAVALFSDRKAPDYRNSIKESISAVEAMCKILTGDEKATLNTALRQLENAGIPLHSALKQGFDKLYAYTGDVGGIRHALLDESTLDFDDAKFMLVSCSAFVNYLAAKAGKAGLIAAGK